MFIEQFLETYNDSALQRLEFAATNSRVYFQYPSSCFVGRHQMGYEGAKKFHYPLGANAEEEYRHMMTTGAKLLPLIEAEKARREAERQLVPVVVPDVTPEEIPEEVCV